MSAAPSALPRAGMRLTRTRRLAGIGLVVVGGPLGTLALVRLGTGLSLGAVLMLYVLMVVVAAAVGGLEAAGLAVVAGFLLANWFFVPPRHTFAVDSRDAVVELTVFVVVGGVVGLTVQLAAREQAAAARSRLGSQVLSRLSAEPVSDASVVGVLDEARRVLGMDTMALVRRGVGAPLARVGATPTGVPDLVLDAGSDLQLVGYGPEPFAAERSLLTGLAGAAARAWDAQVLAEQAARARELAEGEQVRTALLAAVGHDLRTPLAGIKAAVSSLRSTEVEWSDDERAELLEAVEQGADRLSDLLANLLDLSRLQAGALAVHRVPVDLDEVVGRALLTLSDEQVQVDVPAGLPPVLTDPGLAERVVANVVDNARRYAPAGSRVRVEAEAVDDAVQLRVVDHGPGVPEGQWRHLFEPFRRLDDRSAGVGLGLAIAHGFAEALGGSLAPSRTPGGGLTMTLRLPLAGRQAEPTPGETA